MTEYKVGDIVIDEDRKIGWITGVSINRRHQYDTAYDVEFLDRSIFYHEALFAPELTLVWPADE